jgi:hypothetical protein
MQYPKTPKLTPWNVAIGIPLTIGVDITESRSRTKEAKSSIVRGVAGLSMATRPSSQVSAAQARPGLVDEDTLESQRCDPEIDGTCRLGRNHGDQETAHIKQEIVRMTIATSTEALQKL